MDAAWPGRSISRLAARGVSVVQRQVSHRPAVPAAFGAARRLDQIGGSGFESVGIRISQCEYRVFSGL